MYKLTLVHNIQPILMDFYALKHFKINNTDEHHAVFLQCAPAEFVMRFQLSPATFVFASLTVMIAFHGTTAILFGTVPRN